MRPSWKALLVLPPLALGAAILVWQIVGREAPERAAIAERARTARIVTVPRIDVVPRAIGYGAVTPDRVWNAVAEVKGRIVYRDPGLRRGAVLAAGTLIARIAATDFELGVAEIEARIRGLDAQIAEIGVKGENTKASLEIEQRALAINRREFERKRSLAAKKTIAQAALDQEERKVLAQRQTVRSLTNTLNLLPSQRGVLEEQLAAERTRLEQAKRDLERTAIVLPFDARIAEVGVELTQFVQAGQVLAVADSIAASEVEAQIPIEKFRNVLGNELAGDEMGGRESGAPISLPVDFQKVGERLGLSAVLRLRAGDLSVDWDASFARMSDTADPQTRTVGVIVSVANSYRRAIPGKRPPLFKGMFVEVEIRGRPLTRRLVVPRAALTNGAVYIADADNRLRRRPVTVAFFQTNFAVIRDGLSAGDRVVVSDISPAIAGMRLDPVNDEAAAARLVAEAQGIGAPE